MTRKGRIRLAVVFLLVLVGLAYFWRGESGVEIEPGSTLVLRIGGAYAEAPTAPILGKLLGDTRRPFIDLLSTLDMARRDDRLGAVVIRLRDLQVGWGKAQEMRDAIRSVREAGRRVVVLLETQGLSANGEYYVASVADEIYALPGAMVPVMGLAAEYYFLGGLWEKIGLEFDVAKAGRFKSAVEGLAGKGFSEASREMANSLLDSIDRQFVLGIAKGRDLSVEQVRAAIDSGPILPRELLSLGLIDGVDHLDDLPDFCDCNVVHGSDYASMDPASVGFESQATYAIVYGSGPVVSGSAQITPTGTPVFAAETFSKAVDDAVESDEIDGVILRLDTPGGSAMASEEIWYAVQRAREKGKPIVASFSDVAASGGYYVAVAADAIVSPPAALTGSIGVFALRPIIKPVLEELGIGVETLLRGRYADFQLTLSRPSAGAQARLERSVQEIYRLFVDRVATGRALNVHYVDEQGQGRVWTGEQAFERGLVDELGGLKKAVQWINRFHGLEEEADVVLVPFPKRQSLGEQLADLLQLRIAATLKAMLPVALPTSIERLRTFLAALPPEAPLVVPPVFVEIH